MRVSRSVLVVTLLVHATLVLVSACDEPPATPARSAASVGATARSPARTPVFVDRMKQATYERGLVRLKAIRDALLSPSLGSAQTTELGFECASLLATRQQLMAEPDPIVQRLRADIEKTCGLDVPLAASYVELRGVAAKRAEHASPKSECLGLQVALGDFGPAYVSNPLVTDVAGKFAAWCNLGP